MEPFHGESFTLLQHRRMKEKVFRNLLINVGDTEFDEVEVDDLLDELRIEGAYEEGENGGRVCWQVLRGVYEEGENGGRVCWQVLRGAYEEGEDGRRCMQEYRGNWLWRRRREVRFSSRGGCAGQRRLQVGDEMVRGVKLGSERRGGKDVPLTLLTTTNIIVPASMVAELATELISFHCSVLESLCWCLDRSATSASGLAV